LKGLEEIDFSDSMKDIQRNWIGKSVGARIDFDLTPGPSPEERGRDSNLVYPTFQIQ
jgi:leucyl-tRNA synthetase